jgi:hypothetical protein
MAYGDTTIVFGVSPSAQPARIPRGQPGAGQFTSDDRTHAQIRDLNANVAKAFQAHVIETYQAMPLKRPGVSSGRLEKALANPENRTYSTFGWGVGNIDYLDRSEAKYWRMIEEGSAGIYGGGRGMIGQKIYGVWGGSIQGYYENRWGLQPRAGGPWRTAAENGKLRGMTAKAAKKRKMPAMIVQHEIEPHHYFRDADETYAPTAVWAAGIEDILRGALGRELTVNTQPVHVRRASMPWLG